MDWDDFPVILGQGSCHEMNDREKPEGRMWRFKSTSKAACIAYDKTEPEKPRRVGFVMNRLKS